MTDPNTTVSGTDGSNSEPPIPKFENNSSASPTSGVDTKALAKEVAELLRPDFEKVAQSTKDKRIAAIEKRLGVGDLAELEGLGVKIPDEIKTEYRFRQLEQERTSNPTSQQASPPGNGAALTAQSVSEIVKKLNLDANDAE